MDRPVLLLTDTLLVRGRIEARARRLSSYLNKTNRRFIAIADASVLDVESGTVTESSAIHLHRDAIVVAHEFFENAGQELLKLLSDADARDRVAVRLRLRWPSVPAIAGSLPRSTFHASDFGQPDFLVLTEPKIERLAEPPRRDGEVLKSLRYLIVNRARIEAAIAL